VANSQNLCQLGQCFFRSVFLIAAEENDLPSNAATLGSLKDYSGDGDSNAAR
jgi:hypothetical protein